MCNHTLFNVTHTYRDSLHWQRALNKVYSDKYLQIWIVSGEGSPRWSMWWTKVVWTVPCLEQCRLSNSIDKVFTCRHWNGVQWLVKGQQVPVVSSTPYLPYPPLSPSLPPSLPLPVDSCIHGDRVQARCAQSSSLRHPGSTCVSMYRAMLDGRCFSNCGCKQN